MKLILWPALCETVIKVLDIWRKTVITRERPPGLLRKYFGNAQCLSLPSLSLHSIGRNLQFIYKDLHFTCFFTTSFFLTLSSISSCFFSIHYCHYITIFNPGTLSNFGYFSLLHWVVVCMRSRAIFVIIIRKMKSSNGNFLQFHVE